MSMPPRSRAFLALTLALCAATVLASIPSASTTVPAPEPSSPTPGLRAFIDPQTGELVEPTAEDLARVADPAAVVLHRNPDLEVIEHPGGMRSVVLDESFMSTSVARIGADGRLITDCVTNPQALEAFFADEPVAPTTAELEVQ